MTPPTRDIPESTALDAVLAGLTGEPAEVRDDIGRLAILVFLAGDRHDRGDRFVAAITVGLDLSEDDIQRLMPPARLALETLTVTPPAADEARHHVFALLCAVANTSRPPSNAQVQILGRIGAGYGFSEETVDHVLAVALELPTATAQTN